MNHKNTIINERKDIDYKQDAEFDLNLSSLDCKTQDLSYKIATRGVEFYTLKQSNLSKTDNWATELLSPLEQRREKVWGKFTQAILLNKLDTTEFMNRRYSYLFNRPVSKKFLPYHATKQVASLEV